MKCTPKYVRILASCWPAVLLTCTLWLASQARAEDVFPVLEAGSQTYSNVTVTSKTSHYIVITHARGMTSVKLKDLSRDVLKGLGYNVDPPVSKQKQLLAKIQLDPRIKEMQEKITQEVQDRFHQLDQSSLRSGLACLATLYLFFCYSSMLLCKKTGKEPGILVWIPIFQFVPLLKAAGMSAWWFVLCLCLLPVVGLVAMICWSVKICQARGKSSWLALFLLLPVTSIFTFLYLAFSGGGIRKDPKPERITFN